MTSWSSGMKAGDPYMGDATPPDQRSRNTVEALKQVTAEIKKLRKPTGERQAPGRTCREIAVAAEEPLRNGMYWVDPNGGGIADAIEVFCRFDQEKFDKTQTCLVPSTDKWEKQTWFKSKPVGGEAAMFAETFAEEEFSYKTHKSQIKFLQRLAKQARQRITIQCRNVVAVYDSQNRTYEQAVKLLSFDEEEMSVHGQKAFRYKVVSDGCQERNGEWGETVLEVRGREPRLQRLPIVDIGLLDIAGSEQEFGLQLGRACFSS